MGLKDYFLGSFVGGFIATTCCIAPIVLVLLGFGTALSMTVMHNFHLVSIVSGTVLMLLIILYIVKRKSGRCNVNSISKNWKSIFLTIVFMFGVWAFLNYLIIAPIAASVYGSLEVNQKPLGNIIEMAESHGMPEMKKIKVIPEKEGMKILHLEIEGVFCGSCGPAIQYDVKSILGVKEVSQEGSKMIVKYDSDVTSKDVIVASIHDPYSAKIISEEKVNE